MTERPTLRSWLQRTAAWLRRVDWRGIARPVLALLTVAILSALIYTHMDYYQVGSLMEQLRPGMPAPQDIRAARQVSLEDLDETTRQREKAASEVEPRYEGNPTARADARRDLDALFAALYASTPSTEQTALLTAKNITPAMTDGIRALSASARQQLQTATTSVLSDIMSAPIMGGEDEPQALLRAEEFINARMPTTQAQLALQAIRAVLRPTLVVNEASTTQARAEARARVEPVMRQYERSQVVVLKGTLISEALLEQLKTAGLLSPPPLTRIAPIVALMLFAVFAIGLYLRNFCQPVFSHFRKLLLLAMLIIVALTAHISFGANQHMETAICLIAIPAGNMTIAGLLGVPVAIVSMLLMIIAAGLTAHGFAAQHQFAVVLLTMGASLAGVMIVSAIWPASRAASAVLTLFGINLLLLVIITGLLPGITLASLWASSGKLALIAAAGSIGAVIVSAGAIYILARPFGVTTLYRLMELTNPREPLLRRLITEAPGTYHSSVMVANMAEAAADATGADVLLTRVAALYHDIGKLKRPAFFVENQAPLGVDNVHQRLSPKLSYLILTSHVRDGVELGKKARLPDEILTIIREHHGTTLAAYFYHRAVSEAGEQSVPEHEFRYPGPIPSSREAALVMLADSVQASVKALKEPTPPRIEGMIRDIISSRLEDGQLENCDLTLRDLRQVSEVFTRILCGLYTYTRVEYPVSKGDATRAHVYLNSANAPPARDASAGTAGH